MGQVESIPLPEWKHHHSSWYLWQWAGEQPEQSIVIYIRRKMSVNTFIKFCVPKDLRCFKLTCCYHLLLSTLQLHIIFSLTYNMLTFQNVSSYHDKQNELSWLDICKLGARKMKFDVAYWGVWGSFFINIGSLPREQCIVFKPHSSFRSVQELIEQTGNISLWQLLCMICQSGSVDCWM